MAALLASIPSPSQGVWHLGPIPIRGYALAIITGIVLAVWLTTKRWVARGHRAEDVMDVAMWAVPAGIIGGRLYHLATDWQTYFGDQGRGIVAALSIWRGGLGIWGAIALGFLAAWYACRRMGLSVAEFADAAAPGIVLAQAAGRLGNWFNQELFGRPTTLPWGLEIDPANRPAGYGQYATFHPTFLYELLGCVIIAWIIIRFGDRLAPQKGQLFALYVTLYCALRFVVESFRIDTAHRFFGLRLNEFTSVIVGLAAFAVYRRLRRK
ncbi:MAG: prolipoprotein diacylglyceryl transferase [Candidatus Nanopelagicales bacterium]